MAQPIRWLGLGLLLTIGGAMVCCVGPFILGLASVITTVVAGNLGRWDLSVASAAVFLVGFAYFVFSRRRSKGGENS